MNHHQMGDGGKFDYKIEFVGLFVLDEDFLLGEEKTKSPSSTIYMESHF